ncbi:MAG: hypothetical protein ACE5H7_12715 [Acidiferrobacterales bacterium]
MPVLQSAGQVMTQNSTAAMAGACMHHRPVPHGLWEALALACPANGRAIFAGRRPE